jgi:hypothetical protein
VGGVFIHDLENLACGEEETNYRSSFLACDPTLPVLSYTGRNREVKVVALGRRAGLHPNEKE